jgi:hypothetical protein
MTQQYIVGELSILIAGLRPDHYPLLAASVKDLQRRVESAPLTALGPLVREAMDVADAACWNSLEQGDVGSFNQEATEAANLREFALCAKLLS